MCVSCVVSKLCVRELCVCVSCVVSELCVCAAESGRRREEAGGRRQAGVHNQKQEPHTKMWGKKQVGSAEGLTVKLPLPISC